MMETTQKPKSTYLKVASARMFPNNSENPNAPAYGNGKVEVQEDLKKGDIISFSGWVNQSETGEKQLTIQIQKRVEAGQEAARNDPPF